MENFFFCAVYAFENEPFGKLFTLSLYHNNLLVLYQFKKIYSARLLEITPRPLHLRAIRFL